MSISGSLSGLFSGGSSSAAKRQLIDEERALPGRDEAMPVPARHVVLGNPLAGPYPAGLEVAYFAMGCFWGAEEIFWQVPGVWTTAAGYQGGYTPNPTYQEVCSGRTGHTESVLVVYDPSVVSYTELLRIFWEHHDPTQGFRQGNDMGTQYRSAAYWTSDEQRREIEATRERYEPVLVAARYDPITTEVTEAGPFYFAEDYHQQYLAKNPHGYRCHSATGIALPSEG